MSDERPECLGWHQPDPLCDGDGGAEAPCAWRERCLAVNTLFEKQTKSAVTAAVLSAEGAGWLITEEAGRAVLSPSEPEPEPETPAKPTKSKKAPKKAEKKEPRPRAVRSMDRAALGTIRTAPKVHPKPTEFPAVVPLVEAFAERLAKELGRDLLPEGHKDLRAGDLFIRWTPGMQGRMGAIYEAVPGGTTRHYLLTRFIMTKRRPIYNLKTGIRAEQFLPAVDRKPPTGVECKTWKDTRSCVALVGVDEHATREAANWLARCYHADLITRPVRAKSKIRKDRK